MATKTFTIVAVILAVIATALCEESTAESTICPVGEAPVCQINTKFRTQIEKYPHPSSCKWYYLCSNGIPHCIPCGEGLYYDPGTERCDTAVPVGCEEASVSEPDTTEAATPTPTIPPTDPPTTPPTEECPGGHHPSVPQCPVCECDGNTFLHPYDCEWYYECELDVPVLKHCEGGFHWNDKSKVCDYPCLAGCSDTSPEPSVDPTTVPSTQPSVDTTTVPATRPTAATSPDTTQANTTPSVNPPPVCPDAPLPDCPDVDPTMAVFFPHPTSCSYYFECSNNIARCMPCPAGLYFNVAIDDCDYPDDSGCTAGP